jgi:hypothetical protein
LAQSGLILRAQFFRPFHIHPALPPESHMLVGGSLPVTSPEHSMWSEAFVFRFGEGKCVVLARNFGITVPVSHDPNKPFAKHLRIVPTKYKLRPNFGMAFE